MRALFLATLVCTPAFAGPLADRAFDAFENVDYAAAARLMTRALAEENLDAPSLTRAYLALGTSWLALGEDDNATAAFATLFALDPRRRADPDASPKVQAAMRRAAQAEPPAPGIVHRPPPALAGDVVRLSAEVTAAPSLAPTIEYRVDTHRRLRARLDCDGNQCRALLPVAGAAQLEYRLGLLTPEGALALPTPTVLLERAPEPPPPRPSSSLSSSSLPSSSLPSSLPPPSRLPSPLVAAAPRPSNHTRAWIWGSVAVVAAAGLAVGLGVGLTTRIYPGGPMVTYAR